MGGRTRASFRVLLSRDFSRLPQMKSLLAGYDCIMVLVHAVFLKLAKKLK